MQMRLIRQEKDIFSQGLRTGVNVWYILQYREEASSAEENMGDSPWKTVPVLHWNSLSLEEQVNIQEELSK
jgi:hypothetical protein